MYEVVWPRGKKTVAGMPLAKRLDTLSGKTVAELWDWLFHGDTIFPMLEEELSKRYPGVKFISYKKFESTHSAKEAEMVAGLHRQLKDYGVDAVISGIGC